MLHVGYNAQKKSKKKQKQKKTMVMAAGALCVGAVSARLEFTVEVPFPSQREASIAVQSLFPDREPRKGGITKTLSVSANILSVKWTADEARVLRVAVASFLDHLALVMETMDAFGQTMPQ